MLKHGSDREFCTTAGIMLKIPPAAAWADQIYELEMIFFLIEPMLAYKMGYVKVNREVVQVYSA